MARRICAWCKADMGPAHFSLEDDTHGMCEECAERYAAEEPYVEPTCAEMEAYLLEMALAEGEPRQIDDPLPTIELLGGDDA